MTTVQYADLSGARRIIAVSDIHGHKRYLERLLQMVGFGAGDVLVIVGDVLERGAESLATLRYVMALCRTHTVYVLPGNVDLWAMDKALRLDAEGLVMDAKRFLGWYGGSFLLDLAEEIGVPIAPDMDVGAFREGVRRCFADEYAFIEGLPTILQTDGYTFVHGGIPEGPAGALAGQPRLQFLRRDAFIDEGLRMSQWTVVGHWPVCLYEKITGLLQFDPLVYEAQRVVAIDGGCGIKKEGQLNALMIEDGRFSSVRYDELPVRHALTAQRATEKPRVITYMNGAVDIVEKAGDFVQVAHQPDGYLIWVPQSCVYTRDGETRCGEMTDYLLPVSPGDALRVVMQTTRGAVCKKDGVIGWYHGRFEPESA